MHKAFFKKAKNPHGTGTGTAKSFLYGGVSLFFVNQVLFIYEGKVNDLNTDENVGVAMNYLNLLCNAGSQMPRGLLFNKENLIALDGVASSLRTGSWATTSKEVLTNFILETKYSPLTSALVSACKDLDVQCTLGGYIANGAFGHVFEVTANDSSSRTRTETMALKVFLKSSDEDRQFQFRVEDEFIRGREAYAAVPDLVIPLHNTYTVSEKYGAILYERVACGLQMVIGKRHRILSLLMELHVHGYTHGDARVPNIVELHGKLFFIDFSTFTQLSRRMEPRREIISELRTLFTSCEWKYTESIKTLVERYADIICTASLVIEDKRQAAATVIQSISDIVLQNYNYGRT